MIIFKHSTDLHSYLEKIRITNKTIGFVPTMGALHDGHFSLIEECRKQSSLTICTIFVNPTQFNNPEDFKKYPVTIEKDILFLEEHACDILFLPDEKEIYPDAASKKKHFDLGYIETILEGQFRPGHFQGVCLIMEKLLNIINPDFLFLGQKDFQQCLVIKKLISMMNLKVNVVICPTLREQNGLAMSSRNTRLTNQERTVAAELHACLQFIKKNLTKDNFYKLRTNAILYLEKAGFKIDYLELANTKNLALMDHYESKENLIILIAAYLNNVRLIDNLLINN